MIPAVVVGSIFLLALSLPVFLVFGLGSGAVAILGLNLPWSTMIQVSFAAVTKHVLLAIPLFIFAGLIMLRSGIARRLVDLSTALVGHWPGGLGVAMILTMGFFSAFSGSILAAITAVGTIMMPAMFRNGYPKPFTVVLAASAGLIDALIPPSNAAIIYSSLTGVPVSDTFAAGVFPGLALMAILIVVVMIRCWNFERTERASWSQRLHVFMRALPSLTTPVVILGGIYAGLLTPSESAAAAGIWSIVIGLFIHRELTIIGIWEALRSSAVITAVIFAIIAMATFLSVVLTYTQGPQHMTSFLLDFGVGPITFLLIVGVVCLVLGTFVELVPIFFLTVPIFMAVAMAMDVSLLHLYIVFAGFVGIGLLTPPVCMGLYTAAAVADISPEKAFREVPLFIAVGIAYGVLMIFTPWLSTWLPAVLK